MSNSLERFLGDSIGRTILKLLVLSFVVGVVMAAFNWYPIDVFYIVRDFLVQLWQSGFEALGRFGGYLALGAGVVIPAFIVIRLLNMRK